MGIFKSTVNSLIASACEPEELQGKINDFFVRKSIKAKLTHNSGTSYSMKFVDHCNASKSVSNANSFLKTHSLHKTFRATTVSGSEVNLQKIAD